MRVLRKVLRSLKENNSPPPEFKTDEDRTYYYIKFKVNPEVQTVENEKGPMSDDNHLRILLSLKEGSLSRQEIMERLGLKKRNGSFKRTLKDLLEKEMIEYMIPEKPRSRNPKYRITEKGSIELDRAVKGTLDH